MPRFYLTTAIDYVNSRPHLGTAYEKITADVIARYKRLAGLDTHFVMGNDEHSQNVFRRARELGKDPLAYCDDMEGQFREVWRALDLSFDDFIRTTQGRHKAAVETIVRRIADAGDLYQADYEGWYCVGCEAFKQEKDLVEGLCPIHRTKPDWIKERNHFFRLSAYRDRLRAHFADHPDFLQPESRRNEILSLLESGLEDISISRAGQSWGIPLPTDPSSVVYVWFDALINYASAVGLGTDPALFDTWWPADLHVVGKDITRFHCVIWPAMLMSAKLPVPRQVFGHGWVHLRGEKMSKSLGTAVDPLEAAQRFGADALRLFLTKEIPYGADGDFTFERFEERYNADLANNLGNLVSRVTAMGARYRQGHLTPTASPSRLRDLAETTVGEYRAAMDAFALHQGVASVFRLLDATNEYLAERAPWTLAKDPANAAALDEVLFTAAESLRLAAVLLGPVMPASSQAILARLGDPSPLATRRLATDGTWRAEGARTVAAGDALWPRAESAPVVPPVTAPAVTVAKPGVASVSEPESSPVPSAAPPAGTTAHVPGATPVQVAVAAAPEAEGGVITIDDFMKVELRVGKVLAAEAVPKSKKLLKLTVQDGPESERTILAGIAESYTPEAIVGRTIAFVANLAPRPMMGLVSHGMVLAADTDGKAQLISFETPPAPGTRIR
ncbi:methionine--tRNA ligase [Luteitalea sp. TBR-22]|uniref:methionine--tRNA ligase n=1 Tax=Luteitalea sp. TBR-22 TaxID=2802971 RepID=UPI001AF329AA|nr:methionine--tRNA ligase [Luteitalea sp. TBR-22]BCS33300.1 methionine--tRNA ligase [Luteitalea sp. TBR-22]